MTETVAMFPLGSVLFPHMPVVLRVFEDRYLAMLSEILQNEPAEFGVTLIERGQEVGGGEQRFATGTIAEITQLDIQEGFVMLVAEGGRRFTVDNWLEEDPYPSAQVAELPDLEWDESLRSLRVRAEDSVRRALARASEFADQQWSATVELADDDVAAAWQLAAIAPLGPMDQVQLLAVTSMKALLESLVELSIAAEQVLLMSWPDDLEGLDSDDDELDD